MDQYNIREKGLTKSELENKGYGRSNRGLSVWLMALVVSVATVLCSDTPSIAGSFLFLATPSSQNKIDVNTVLQSSTSHSSVLAAAFGSQAAGSSIITIRTYDGPTGAILSEDSFDVNIKEEGGTEHDASKGRIFAGGIGIDAEGQSRFILRVYDAESGRFLWEGQLNLLTTPDGGMTKAQVAARSIDPITIQTSSDKQAPFQILFSLRAINSVTGALLWQDQFATGSSRKRKKGRGVILEAPAMKPTDQLVERIFGLSVRAYDRTTGTLLWEDSFEQSDHEDPAVEPYTNAYPQAIPSWSPSVTENDKSHPIVLR